MTGSRFKTTYILLLVFVVLLAFVVFYAREGVQQQQVQDEIDAPYLSSAFLEDLSLVSFADTGITLEKKDSTWMVQSGSNSFAVSRFLFDSLMSSLEEFPEGKKVSVNADNSARYGFAPEDTPDVVLFDDSKEFVEITFGNSGTNRQNIYLRRDDDKDVYLVNTNLPFISRLSLERWRDKSLLPVPQDNVVGVKVRLGKETWSFVSENGDWSFVEGDTTTSINDKEALSAYLDQLFTTSGTSHDADTALIQESDSAIALQLQDGSEFVVTIDHGEATDSYALLSENVNEVLVIPTASVEALRPTFLEAESEKAGPSVESSADEGAS